MDKCPFYPGDPDCRSISIGFWMRASDNELTCQPAKHVLKTGFFFLSSCHAVNTHECTVHQAEGRQLQISLISMVSSFGQEDRVSFHTQRELDSAYFTMKDRGGANTQDLLEIGVCVNNGTHLIEHKRWGPSRVNIGDNQVENLTSANTIFGPWWFHYVSQIHVFFVVLHITRLKLDIINFFSEKITQFFEGDHCVERQRNQALHERNREALQDVP